jgi:chemotaxis methyl-accepting protein methylase
LIGVTQFFREREVFAYLDREILPTLSRHAQGVRVWSAGCANGAELYSLALLLARRGMLESSMLLGTDCRAAAVAQARRGWFEWSQLNHVEDALRQAYFVADGHGTRVRASIRDALAWQQGDVLAGSASGEAAWDLILCRNLAIYLEPAAAARLWSVLAESLRVGGILVAGKAERPEPRSAWARLAPCIFRRQR